MVVLVLTRIECFFDHRGFSVFSSLYHFMFLITLLKPLLMINPQDLCHLKQGYNASNLSKGHHKSVWVSLIDILFRLKNHLIVDLVNLQLLVRSNDVGERLHYPRVNDRC